MEDLCGLFFEEFGKFVFGDESFARGDWDAGVGGDASHFVDVFRGDGFLEPEGAEFFQFFCHADCAGCAELSVGADADFQFVADRVPDAFEYFGDVANGFEWEVARVGKEGLEGVEFAGGVSLCDQASCDFTCAFWIFPDAVGWHVGISSEFVVNPAAEQVVDGLVQCFADDVPTRHFNGTQGRCCVEAGVAIVVPRCKDALPQAFDVKGACADGELLTQVFDEADLGVQIGGISRGSLAQSDNAFVCDELDKEPVSPPR